MRFMIFKVCLVLFLLPEVFFGQGKDLDLFLNQVEHGYAVNQGIRLHYVSIGKGPLIVMLPGFPDYWLTWRDQMLALKDRFQLVALDLRDDNKSEQLQGIEGYSMKKLMDDVEVVIQSLGKQKAIIVGHDWGGAIARQIAIDRPALVEKLIICDMTHPTGRVIESLQHLRDNNNNSYVDNFRKHTSETLSISWLTGWISDPLIKSYYAEAFKRSFIDAMINYYRANTLTKAERAAWVVDPMVKKHDKLSMPVVMLFGTNDRHVRKEGLNNTWDYLDTDLTLVTIPTAGHFVHQDASELVSKSMRMWLLRDDTLLRELQELPTLKWLLGTWYYDSGPKRYFECWKQRSNYAMEGTSYYLSDETTDTTFTESILLTKIGPDYYYLPKTNSNPNPVPFKLVLLEEDKVVFENPEHDFPQRITYHRHNDKRMRASIEDMDARKVIHFDFYRFERE